MPNKVPYSYHTFLYPFRIENGDYFSFQSKFDKDDKWEKNDLVDECGKTLHAVTSEQDGYARLDYQTFQYFTPAARKALFGADRDIVSCYRRRDAKGGKYTIKRGEFSDELLIEAVRLKLFNTNIGIIVFEMEYHPSETLTAVEKQAAVKRINEWGRRLYPEYLRKERFDEKEKETQLLCADELTIVLQDQTIFREQFKARQEADKPYQEYSIYDGSYPAKDNPYLRDPIYLPEVITKLLGIEENDIEPAIDDRMFVCCVVMDDAYTSSFIHPGGGKNSTDAQKHDWRFMTDYKIGCELYAVTNIDATDSSCQNRLMLDQYFEEQLYLRWIEWGTIHAVTNHSMICLTGDPQYVMDSVVNPFLIEYVQMCILGLAQRASLLAFDAKITNAIKDARGKTKPLSGKMLDDLIALAEDFAVFQGQLLIQEVTPQIQGIELYQRIQKMLFIPSLEKNIQHQLNNLYQIAEANRDKQDAEKDQKMQGAFTAIAILAIASAWTDAYDFIRHFITKEDFTQTLWWGVLAAILIIVIGIFEYWYKGRLIRSWLDRIYHVLFKRKKGKNE